MSDKPTNVQAGAGVQSVTLSWQPGSSVLIASGFRITIFVNGTQSSTKDVAPTSLAILQNLPSQPHKFKVTPLYQAIPPGTTSDFSNEVTPLPSTSSGTATAPSKPTNVTGTAKLGEIEVNWTLPPSTQGPFVSSEVVPYANGQALASMIVSGTQTKTAVPAAPSIDYTFKVRTLNGVGWSPYSDLSAPVRVQEFVPKLPLLSTKSFLPLDTDLELDRRLLTAASAAAGKWRFEYLKNQALKAAGEVSAFEAEISKLMSMALDKTVGAEQLLNPMLIQSIQDIQKAITRVQDVATSDSVDEGIKSVANAVAQATMLGRILVFLAQYEPADFWIDLFNALIGDIATMDAGLTDTRAHLEKTFGSNDLGAAIKDLVDDMLGRLDAEVDGIVAPLKDSIGELIAGTDEAMGKVFAAFDTTLLQRPSEIPGESPAPDVNPLSVLNDQLTGLVDELADQIKAELEKVLTAARQDSTLFTTLIVTYVVTPLLAFLVVAISSGPIGAAALGAVVLVGAQKLIQLVVRWLTGPLQGQLDQVNERLRDAMRQLGEIFAREAEALGAITPGVYLDVVSQQLLQLKELLPDAFLEDAANILGRARDVMLRGALQSALAAERSLGMENATAFDVVPYDYEPPRVNAPQLPGGSDPGRLSGARLVRDLGRLEQQRTAVTDGKELEVTQRFSLRELLGGPDRFAEFAKRGEVVVHLQNEHLDRQFAGLYRALIKDVQVEGVVADPPEGVWSAGFPVTVTHLGASETRIRRGTNPEAPPLELPECLPSSEEFLSGLFDAKQLRTWTEEAVAAWKKNHPGSPTVEQMVAAAKELIPDALATKARSLSCDLVDGAPVKAAAEELFDEFPRTLASWYHFSPLPGTTLSETGFDFSLTTSDIAPRFVARGDFDGDGREELVFTVDKATTEGNDMWVTKYDAQNQRWAPLGQKAGHPFGASIDLSGKDVSVRVVAVGDFDGDNRDEILAAPEVAGEEGDDLWIADFNPSTSTWGVLDPISGHASGASIDLSALIKDEAGLLDWQPGPQGKIALAVAGDFDNDNRDEIAIAFDTSGVPGNAFWVLDRKPGGGWSLLSTTPNWAPRGDTSTEAFDLEDYALSQFSYVYGDLSVTPRFAVAGDFNGDGIDELAVGVDSPTEGRSGLWVMGYDTSNEVWSQVTVPNYWGQQPAVPTTQGKFEWAVTGDFDGDGRPEIALVQSGSGGQGNDLWVLDYQTEWSTGWRWLGGSDYWASIDISAWDEAGVLVSGDFDGDQRDELAIALARAGTTGNDFYVLKNSNGNWHPLGEVASGYPYVDHYQVDVSAAEFAAKTAISVDANGDGRDELVVLPVITSKQRDDWSVLRFFTGLLGGYDIGPDSRADNGWVMAYRSFDDMEDLVENIVVTGLMAGGDVRKAARTAYEAVVDELTDHIAKWGEADLREDSDHHVGSLGFATLTRQHPVETAVFNLVAESDQMNPVDSSVVARATPLAADSDGHPAGVPTTLQYRPFENFGFDGRMLIALPGVPPEGGDGTLASLGALASSGIGTARLSDILLSVTVRGCFDEDLAATVKASRRQQGSQGEAASVAAGKLVSLPLGPGESAGESELRTVHLSLRAHRDLTLQSWLAAAQAQAGTTTLTADPITLPNSSVGFAKATAPLIPGAPFSFLSSGQFHPRARHGFTLRFAENEATSPSLADLETILQVTPADLGLEAAGELVELGIAVIPTEKIGDPDFSSLSPIKLKVDQALKELLPGFDQSSDIERWLLTTTRLADSTEPSVDLQGVWAAKPALTLDLGAWVRTGALYDVLFSFVYNMSLLEVAAG